MSNEIIKCLDCGNTTKFIIPYIDRTLTTYDEHGGIVAEESVSYQSYDDERIVCGAYDCNNSDNLSIYQEK